VRRKPFSTYCELCASEHWRGRIVMMLLRRKSLRALLLGVIVFGSQVATCAQSEKPVDRILIEKSAHLMTLYRGNQAIRKYKVALGTQPVGRKERQGDHKTREGLYTVDRKNPQSIFHMALHLSYPNAEDRKRAKKLGVDPGGDVEIHGLEKKYAYLGALHRQPDWTDGCIAVTNAEIEEIWKLVPVGTRVEIRP
jgi:murein L,D-transpeptidase YafK